MPYIQNGLLLRSDSPMCGGVIMMQPVQMSTAGLTLLWQTGALIGRFQDRMKRYGLKMGMTELLIRQMDYITTRQVRLKMRHSGKPQWGIEHMKKIIAILFLLAITGRAAATDNICAVGFASNKEVSVNIYDATAQSELLAYTSTGVAEYATGYGLSTYCYEGATVPTVCNKLILNWHDDSTPVAIASETKIWDCAAAASSLTPAEIWAYINRSLTSPAYVLPVMQGSIYNPVATPNKEVPVFRGDTPRIIFALFDSADKPADYTGWTPSFGAKAAPKDTAYAIAVKTATWTNAAKGQGYFELTATETAVSRSLFGELELVNGAQHLTAMKFTLKIMDDIVK